MWHVTFSKRKKKSVKRPICIYTSQTGGTQPIGRTTALQLPFHRETWKSANHHGERKNVGEKSIFFYIRGLFVCLFVCLFVWNWCPNYWRDLNQIWHEVPHDPCGQPQNIFLEVDLPGGVYFRKNKKIQTFPV